jgi:serine/threonine-protein kinase
MSQVSATSLIAGRYRLDHQLAADRLAEVWLGTDLELARPVAVKLLHADAGADAVGQFRAAACRAASVTHEGLARVFDYCEPEPQESAQRPLLVMEYVEGPSLAVELRAGTLGSAQAADIIAKVTAAVQAVHRAGLAHGDIRPEKILLTSDGEAKLFGFSGTCPAGSAAIDADLRALGILARDCLAENTARGTSSPLSNQLRASAAGLAALCAGEAVEHPDAGAAIAHQAADLPAQPDQPSTMTFARRPGLTGGPATSAVEQPRVKRGGAAAFGTAAVVAVGLAAVAIVGALKPNFTAPNNGGANLAASVRVTAAQLIGQPVRVVRLKLQRAGLVVRTRWRRSSTVKKGYVVAVRPAGLVPAGSTVVIFGSSGRSAAGTAPTPGQARTAHPHRTSRPPTPGPSASPSNSPTPSPSPTSSPSPSSSPSPPPSSPPPSGSPAPPDSAPG